MLLIILPIVRPQGIPVNQAAMPVCLIYFEAIGIRQPVPKARSVIFKPGGA